MCCLFFADQYIYRGTHSPITDMTSVYLHWQLWAYYNFDARSLITSPMISRCLPRHQLVSVFYYALVMLNRSLNLNHNCTAINNDVGNRIYSFKWLGFTIMPYFVICRQGKGHCWRKQLGVMSSCPVVAKSKFVKIIV